MSDNNEPLSRFATHRTHFKREIRRASPKLFRPNRELKLSVFRTQGMDDGEIQQLGNDKVVAKRRDIEKHYGWATIRRSLVSDLGLSIVDDPPPNRHSDIVGWSKHNPETRKEIQIKLAQDAIPHPLNLPVSVKPQ